MPRFIFFLGLLFSLVSCGVSKNKKLSSDAVEVFHEHFNHSEFTKIYNSSSTELTDTETEMKFEKVMVFFRNKLGSFQGGAQKSWSVNKTTSGDSVKLTLSSHFEHGDGVENFVFVISGETAELKSYSVTSPIFKLQ